MQWKRIICVFCLFVFFQNGYLLGEMVFDVSELEFVISSVIFEIIECEKSVLFVVLQVSMFDQVFVGCGFQ